MFKNILIISSDFTGHGHKSITESLCEFFSEDKNINVHVVDGFSLGGKALLSVGKAYGPITRVSKELWKFIWEASARKPEVVDEIIEFVIKDNLLELLRRTKPDLILSVHPNFNGSVINVLNKYNIKIPFITLIADLVSIYPLWADSRVDYIISPTEEAKKKCIEYGVSESKIKVLGFPVRSRFLNNVEFYEEETNYNSEASLKCLIMSGGEGVGNMSKIAKILLDNFNCTVKIVAGRNITLRNKLEKFLGEKYGDRVEVYGFTKNVQDLMLASDIAFTRGSPNVMMEVISCNIPLVITGALPGQENGNPEFAQKYNLGVVCEKVSELKEVMENLVENNAERLKEIKNSQKNFINSNVAKDIVNFILSIDISGSNAAIPSRKPRYIFLHKNKIGSKFYTVNFRWLVSRNK
ncbi:UDP-N-acetylglucosamine--LPS N-acetylglucosamine transferase [Clostridium sp. 19966]|uniref:MGDG synthase family glycosyltransferase n=1 Tax=Clostridium sp. 19966 TaxID=2768166 RepID=UPI0028DF6536|nr:glycosyltransferase [Clostridium sp. 19966]MDT8718498.1 UDP-N-acetylglucosamine--LPS N-acetylglucosamine transferase [Clostridium sp. 19966]